MYYAIESLDEAKEYLKNDYLRNNLLEKSQALLDLDSNNPTEVLGEPDVLKVKSCMTLFYYADPSISVFKQIIDKYYNGKCDTNTIYLIDRYLKQKETGL